MSSAAERRYRMLLRLLPAALRAEAADEMTAIFRAGHARVAARGRWRRLQFWLVVVLDTVVTALREWRDPFAARAASGEKRGRAYFPGGRMDVRISLRRLWRSPARALLAALTLGLGIAATVVVGVLVRGVLLRPLPFDDADRLVRLIELDERGGTWWPSYPNFTDWREHGRMFDGVVALNVPQVQPVLVGGAAVRAPVGGLSRGFLETIGVQPVLGRAFTDEENSPGGAPAVLVSHDFWQQQLGGRDIGSATVTIGTTQYQVVGVLPRDFRFIADGGAWGDAAVWLPMERSESLGGRSSHGYHVVGRLAQGLPLERARSELNSLATRLREEHGEETQAHSVRMTPLQEVVTGSAKRPLELLLGASFVVLLVASFNLAATLLADGLARGREFAVRLAIGARRRDLLRQLLVEAALLALPAALVGSLLAAAAVQLLRVRAPNALPRMEEVSLDGGALALAVSIAIASALLAGLMPALVLSARSVAHRLRSRGGTAGPQQQKLWNVFVATQVALTLALLFGAGLLLRSFSNAVTAPLGYDPDDVVVADISLPEASYTDPEQRVAFYTAALERVRAVPGVQDAGLTSVLPYIPSMRTAGTRRADDPERYTMAGFRIVDGNYLRAIGVPLLQGNSLDALAPGAAVIDQRLARQLWPNESPIGAGVFNHFSDRDYAVGGVAGTIREWNSNEEGEWAMVYVDYRAQGERLGEMHIVARTAGRPGDAIAPVRAAIASVDPLVPVTIGLLAEQVAGELAEQRLMLVVAAAFALIALLLAAVGVHAIVSFVVTRRARECGIRLALGAPPTKVRGAMLQSGLRPALMGTALGLLVTIPVGRALRSQLFETASADPLAYLVAGGTLLLSALAAGWIPARRASRVDPNVVLREE